LDIEVLKYQVSEALLLLDLLTLYHRGIIMTVEMKKLIKLSDAIEDVLMDGGKDIKGLDYTKLESMSAYLYKIINREE